MHLFHFENLPITTIKLASLYYANKMYTTDHEPKICLGGKESSNLYLYL